MRWLRDTGERVRSNRQRSNTCQIGVLGRGIGKNEENEIFQRQISKMRSINP